MKGIEFYVNLIWLLPFWCRKGPSQPEAESADQAVFSITMDLDAVRQGIITSARFAIYQLRLRFNEPLAAHVELTAIFGTDHPGMIRIVCICRFHAIMVNIVFVVIMAVR